ncbi:MAG: hypothetical protein IT444_10845, partial [Phycisphaeraceae bacterium]|nr:hypothetical protein [Phycisphaeraceae bacterium]
MDNFIFARTRTLNAKRHLWRTIATAVILPASLAGFSSARADNITWDVAGSGAWDTTSLNWDNSGSPDTFTNGDTVTFDTSAAATATYTITVDAGGVTPGAINIGGAPGTSPVIHYNFTGGAIGGASTKMTITSPNDANAAGAIVTLQSANTFGGGIDLGTATKGSDLISQVDGALGTGTITMMGGAGNAGSFIRFNTNPQTISNDIVMAGTSASRHYLSAYVLTRLTGSLTVNDDNIYLYNGTGSARPLEIRPGAGESVTGTGNVLMAHAILSISAANQLPSGYVSIGDRAVVVLDNLSWSSFGRSKGTGSNQWTAIATGGFAARGTPVTINSGNTTDYASGISFGYGDTSYADQSVTLDLPTGSDTLTLTADRAFRAYGDSLFNYVSGLTVKGPLHEIADPITDAGGGYALTIEAYNNTNNSPSYGGQIRLSNSANSFARLNVGGQTSNMSGIVVADSDAALGTSNIYVGTNINNTYGLLFFDDRANVGQTFTRPMIVGAGVTANVPSSGLGAWSGDVTYTGHVTLTDDPTKPDYSTAGNLVVQAQSGAKLTLGTTATAAWFENDRQNITTPATNGAIYRKTGTGEVVLRNIDFTTGSFNANYYWALTDGTLTSENSAYLTSGNLALQNLLAANTNPGRTLHIAVVDHTFNNVASNTFTGSPTVEVDNGITFTTNLTTGNRLYGGTTGAQTLTKTGGGTWVLNSSTALSGSGETTDRFQVDSGVLDVRGDTGNAGFTVNGGTLLSGNVSGFASGRVLEITAAGGKVGVSVNATANVTRSATSINTWTQGGTVTFASRDNYNLAFTNAAFPDITAGTVLF